MSVKVSLNWLKEYVDINVPVQQLCDKMIMAGFEVEDLVDLSATMDKVVVGRILRLEKHPNADKLLVCQVDVGEGQPLQIITGADNVFEGALVPVALHGSHLPNGAQIKKGNLRGLPSEGMLCSGEELCLKDSDYPGAEVHGILILQGDHQPGTDMREVLGLNDVVIDFKITANRPDCQSVLGIAREVAVVLNTAFRPPVPAYATAGGNIHDEISVEVRDFDLCPRYYGRVVKNLRVGPSPEWMQRYLRAAGMRPINNIVDITNFVMLETGHPMHAFDLRDVKGRKIIVRRATDGEKITTLDGKEHVLNTDMLVIADEQFPSCLAGIMGSLNSGIKEDTTELFLECAKFRRDSIRRTARALGIRTESSARFEKGVDIIGVEYAMERALQLIHELGAGDCIDGRIDLHQGLPGPRELTVTGDSIRRLLGIDIPTATMAEILNSLHIQTTLEGEDTLICRIPSFRDDIEGKADLAEEVMRIYGYEHIVSTPMTGTIVRGRRSPERLAADKVKRVLTSQGLREITTYSFISSKAVDTLGLSEDDPRRRTVVLLNPISEDYSTMRTQLVTSMLTVLATNINRKNKAARLFEVSKWFVPNGDSVDELPALALGLYGDGEDFYTLKGLVECICKAFTLDAQFVPSQEPFLHPGRRANVVVNGETVGYIGELHPDMAEKYDIEGVRVYVGELALSPFYRAKIKPVRYQPLPRFPAVERDLAFICDADMPVGEIEAAIRKAAGPLLESVTLFDVYRGAQIEAGKKSVAYSLAFRSPGSTLKDEEITPILQKIYKTLEEKGCILRS